jgi:dolichyl-phosphate-mannose-protein mannosyltransferase
MLVPFAYFTMRGCQFSVATAVLTALMICYGKFLIVIFNINTLSCYFFLENSYIANSRLILLDSILMFFTSFTFLMWINFRNQFKQPFKFWWWIWLVLTGVGLGCTVSSKWVGLFTIASIGVGVLKELWDLWGNQRLATVRYGYCAKEKYTYCYISIHLFIILWLELFA